VRFRGLGFVGRYSKVLAIRRKMEREAKGKKEESINIWSRNERMQHHNVIKSKRTWKAAKGV